MCNGIKIVISKSGYLYGKLQQQFEKLISLHQLSLNEILFVDDTFYIYDKCKNKTEDIV